MKQYHAIWLYIRGHTAVYVLSLILGVLTQVITLLQPKLSGDLIAGVQHRTTVTEIAVVLGFLIVLGATLTAIQQAVLGRIGEKKVYSIRIRMVKKFFSMRTLDREANPPAWYSQRIAGDAALIKSLPTQLLGIMQAMILLVGSGVALIRINLLFFIIIIVPSMTSVLFVMSVSKPIKKWQNDVQDASMDMTLSVQESASAMRVLKAYNATDKERIKLNDVILRAYKSGKKLTYLYSGIGPITQILSQIGNILAILYGAYQVALGNMGFTALIMFLMYFSYFSASTTSIASGVSQLQQALVGIQRINEFMIMTEEEGNDSNIEMLKLADAPVVTFDGVYHCYSPSQGYSLSDVSFSAPAKKITALVGESGGGKTTCLGLLERFFRPTCGSITIDRYDLSCLNLSKLREDVAFVEQDPCILTGTIRNNIKLGRQTATDDDILFVLNQVGLCIAGVSQKELLDRSVGESGLSLSGGQKQRIALARALIREPKLLLMDEPTSNLDGLAEEEIAELIRSRFQNTTVIYSAHRLSLILEADWIVVIKNGKVLDKGSHLDLLNRCEYYRKLIEAQAHSKTCL